MDKKEWYVQKKFNVSVGGIIFYKYFFRNTVNNKIWNKEKRKTKLSEILSISDEALIYLIYENWRNVWLKMIKTGNRKKVDVKIKYTADQNENIYSTMVGLGKDIFVSINM